MANSLRWTEEQYAEHMQKRDRKRTPAPAPAEPTYAPPPPPKRPKARREHERIQQVSLFKWARENEARLPALKMMFAVPNGGLRHKATAGKLKAEGVKAGVPDVFLAAPRGGKHGLFIEMKAGDNTASEPQIDWMAELNLQGYAVAVCYSCDEARRTVEDYLGGG